MKKPGKIDLNYKDISTHKTGIEYGLVTRFILGMVHKTSYILFKSQVCDIVTYAFKKTLSRPKKIESAIIVGRPLVIILNQISTSTRWQDIPTARWVNRPI